jgi:predicted esterase
MSDWEFAVGGFSGGAKGCFFPCATLIREKYKVVGAFMGGCNEDFSERARKELKAPGAGYRTLRAFISSGKQDTIASVSQSANVKKSLKDNGIRDSRMGIHEGGHSLYQPHFAEALKWFAEDRPKDKSTTPLRRLPDNSGAGATL